MPEVALGLALRRELQVDMALVSTGLHLHHQQAQGSMLRGRLGKHGNRHKLITLTTRGTSETNNDNNDNDNDDEQLSR